MTGNVLLRHDRFAGSSLGALAVLALLSSIVVTVVRVHRSGPIAALPAVPLLAFGVHRFGHHAGWALALAVAVLAVSLAFERRPLWAWMERQVGRVALPRRRAVPARGQP